MSVPTATATLRVLYDGNCIFCERQMQRLTRFARPGSITAIDFQQPGALEPFEGLTWDECMKAMVVITPGGKRFVGAAAVVEVLRTRLFLRPLCWLYHVPGLSHLCDALYRMVARRRYRIAGRREAQECDNGACSLHPPPGSD